MKNLINIFQKPLLIRVQTHVVRAMLNFIDVILWMNFTREKKNKKKIIITWVNKYEHTVTHIIIHTPYKFWFSIKIGSLEKQNIILKQKYLFQHFYIKKLQKLKKKKKKKKKLISQDR